ncbi:importin-4-like isoform X2 [Patiria miniata]|uniref:Importin N-terminal domain-containing protein n=1 Tax=Patiria miniata TaxID=46514 RepID=A0A914B2D2_PATMI|nr:importin-4-like isoform X2 [Patiria miniata]
MAAPLEGILHKLLVPNSSVIQEGTRELKQALKDPNIVPGLFAVLTSSNNPQIRQLSAVLLRRRVVKQWTKLPPDVGHNLKQISLQVLLRETDKSVCNAVAQLVGAIAKHELTSRNGWPDLMQFLQQQSRSPESQHKEVGALVLSCVSGSAAEHLRPYLRVLCNLFNTMLQNRESQLVPYYAIKAMTSLVQHLGTDDIPQFRPLIPQVLVVIRLLLGSDEDQGCQAMELFDELVECEVSIIVPHLKAVVEFCCEVASNGNLGNNARVKALSFISWLTSLKKKAILKYKLVNPVLKVLFPIMCTPPEEEEDDEDEDDCGEDAEASTPSSFAAQVIDTMALHLPPDKLLPPLMQLAQPALSSTNPYERKAGLLSIAVLAEGCADFIRNKHLQPLLECICTGIQDTQQVVRNAALFCLGQFAEHLQPDISKYHAQLLPLLFDYLSQASAAAEQSPKGVTRIYYALEMFCENLSSEDLLPYLPTLMERLLVTLKTSTNVHIKELAISAIGATSNAAEKHMLPFFQPIMEHLRVYLTTAQSGDALTLQIQAIDTLGVLARTLGRENFLPLAEECLQLGLKLIEEVNDPDLRRCTYGLFASLSHVLGVEMSPYLETITKLMVDSLLSTEGIVAHYNEEDSGVLSLFDDDDDEASEEDIEGSNHHDNSEEDEDIQGYSVENSYMEEKEDACNSLGEIATNTGVAFMPHLDTCFGEMIKLIDYPAVNVRKAAITSSGHMCCSLRKVIQLTNPQESAALAKAVDQTVPHFIHIVNTETDRTVVMATLETLNEMLGTLQGTMVNEQGNLSGISSAIRNVLQRKTACQDQDDDDDDDDDGDQAEYDAMLIEYAGDLIPSLARALGGQAFAPYFAGTLPLLLSRTKKSCSAAEKSFSVGTLSESVVGMGDAAQPFLPHLLPVFLRMVRDDDEEVRSNAVFGLGVLAQNCGEAAYQHFANILQALSSVMGQETNRRVVDNVCAAVCRLIVTNHSLVPLEEVIPMLLKFLPLQDDLAENDTVYGCILQLYQAAHPTIMENLPSFLTMFAQILHQLTEYATSCVVQIISSTRQNQPDVYTAVLVSLPEPLATTFNMAAVSSVTQTDTPVGAIESDPTQALTNPEPASKDLSKLDKNNSCAQPAKEVAAASTEEVEEASREEVQEVSNEEVEDAFEEMKTETGDGGDKAEDVEYSIIEGSSQRQRPKLVDSRGFAYTLYNRNKDGSTTWRCTLRNRNAFCGTIVRQAGDQFRLGKKDHLHPGTPGQLAMANVVAQVRTAATDHLFEPASSIINNILIKNKADASVVLLPKTRSLIRRACRVREKQYPQHPTDLAFVLEQDAIQKDFLLKDVQVRNRRHLIFSTPNQQVLLARSTRWYMDATSKLVKPPFTQLLGIHCFVKKKQVIKQVPLTYILMTGKKKRDYKLVLKALKKRLPKEICLREIVADFEAPLWGALESVYPEITLKGCCFRWKQAIWRKMQDLGLQPAYKDKGEIYKLLQYVLGLPYLPAEIIPAMLTSMRDMADKELEMLQKLFDYVSSTWIESNQWPPEAWSCYRQCLRTTTDCDGWHQRLKLTARKSRVSLYHLIELLYTEASNVDIRTELVSDKKLQRYQRKVYENTQGKIFTYWKEFESGERTAESLLQGCAYVQGNISVIKH